MNSQVPYNTEETRQSGFTVVEMMIAIAVLAVGLVSVVGMSGYISRANIDSNLISVLSTQSQSEVDALRTATWTVNSCDAPLTVGGSLTSNVDNHYKTVTGTPVGDVIVRWQVTQGGTPDYRYVTVNAIRSGYPGDMKTGLSTTTIILRQ